jgi:hypothetical protein
MGVILQKSGAESLEEVGTVPPSMERGGSGGWLSFVKTAKTGNRVGIPIWPLLDTILKHYFYFAEIFSPNPIAVGIDSVPVHPKQFCRAGRRRYAHLT